MHIQVTLKRDEFEQTLLDLLNRSLGREVQPEQIKSIRLEYGESYKNPTFVATIDFSEPTQPMQ